MGSEEHHRRLERMYASAPVNKYFAPSMHASEGRADVLIKVRPDFFHAAHAVHGVLYFKLLDDAAFFAVNSLVHDVFVLTVSFNIYLTRPVSAGELKAIGRVVHRSKQLFIAESELMNAEGQEIARGSGVFMRSTIVLSPELGYM
ncbi:MAG: PaaI family thioesterase [Desulfobacterales bacterium]|nr:PaaI family thioesterase [Desulfobacterales bacterium]